MKYLFALPQEDIDRLKEAGLIPDTGGRMDHSGSEGAGGTGRPLPVLKNCADAFVFPDFFHIKTVTIITENVPDFQNAKFI